MSRLAGLGGVMFFLAMTSLVSAAGVNYNETTFKPLVTSSDVVGQFTSCTGVQYLGADGACHDVSGSGLWDAVTGGINYAGGNVGIGTTSPQADLHIDGLTPTLLIDSNGGDAELVLSSENNEEWSLKADPGDDFLIDYNSTNRFYIDSVSGNVGIGTTSPTGKLEVNSITNIKMGDINDTEGFPLFIIDGDNQKYTFENGNVGIGTTSPSATLDVNGLAVFGEGNNGKIIISDDYYGGELGILTDSDESIAIKYYDGTFRYGGVNPGAEALTISGSNVGIGTTSPVYKLDVYGPAIRVGEGTGAEVLLGFDVGLGGEAGLIDPSNDYNIAAKMVDGSGYKYGGASSTDTGMFIKSDGNVGIGTTSPSEKLVVHGGELLVNNGPNGVIIGYKNITGEQDEGIYLGDGNQDREILAVHSDGDLKYRYAGNNLIVDYTTTNVGIGNEDPESKLDVNGDIHLTNMTAPTTTTNKLYSVGGVLKWAGSTVATGDLTANTISQLDSSVTVTDTGTNGTITMKTDNATRMTIDNAGNVGIGTASPSSKLELDGKTSYAQLKFSATNLTSRYLKIGMADAANHFIEANGAGSFLTFKTEGSEKVRIDSAGNVGIGVTNPTKKLDVDGGARFSNTSSTDPIEVGSGKIYWDTVNSELVIQVN
jgi:hypothetical protein